MNWLDLWIAAPVGGSFYYLWNHPVFGRLPRGQEKEKRAASPWFSQGQYRNMEPTSMMAPGASPLNFLTSRRAKDRKPQDSLPVSKQLIPSRTEGAPQITWFGHSSYLIQQAGLNVLIDPVFFNAAPVPYMITPFDYEYAHCPDDLPEIDVLIITHDHYDHLDYRSIRQLNRKTKNFVVSAGVGGHLRRWGIATDRIHETAWGESWEHPQGLKLTAAPARHFSGRRLKRNQSHWSAFVWQYQGMQLFLGGDSGYGPHFAEIGREFGPFQLALLECGQYNEMWPNIHMMPEETVQAALDLGAEKLMPVHWGKFALALHGWKEPIERAKAEALKRKLPLFTPELGETSSLKQDTRAWWSGLS